MKKIDIFYWISTLLFAAFMLFTAVPDILMSPDAMTFITNLGYPGYFVPFIGVAKALGSIAIVVPGYPRLKEWAYAGLFFDLVGATYSNVAVGGFQMPMLFMLLPFTLEGLSYGFHHLRLKGK